MPANHVKRAYAPIGKLTPLNLFRISAFHSHKQEGLETNFPPFSRRSFPMPQTFKRQLLSLRDSTIRLPRKHSFPARSLKKGS